MTAAGKFAPGFPESESTDGQTDTTSYENPGSERNALLERLSEAEREIELLPEAPADDAQAGDESTGLSQQERELPDRPRCRMP